MVRLIDSNGLRLNLVKLNGKLELRFVKSANFTAHYTCHGTDIEDTVEMGHAREAAAGQPVVSLGLEMFMEDVEGYLEVRFESAVGSTLSFQYDGRGYDVPLPDPAPQSAFSGSISRSTSTAMTLGALGFQELPATTRSVKTQTMEPDIKNARTQTSALCVTSMGVQTKAKRMVSKGVQVSIKKIAPNSKRTPLPTIVDLTDHDDLMPTFTPAVQVPLQHPTEAVYTFTSAVATVFRTFNEPRDPYRKKRQDEPAADYRAYKHIFIEGYRNGDDREEERRLHIDLIHHVLLWESYDDYEGGAKLTLDRFDLPRCTYSGLTFLLERY